MNHKWPRPVTRKDPRNLDFQHSSDRIWIDPDSLTRLTSIRVRLTSTQYCCFGLRSSFRPLVVLTSISALKTSLVFENTPLSQNGTRNKQPTLVYSRANTPPRSTDSGRSIPNSVCNFSTACSGVKLEFSSLPSR